MTGIRIDPYTRHGIAAVEAHRMDEARELFEEAIRINDRNITAWFYLGLYVISPSREDDRRKALDKARLAALQTEEGFQHYRELLEKTGAPRLNIHIVGPASPALGTRCPLTHHAFQEGDEIVVCQNCDSAHTVSGWEFNGYECAYCGDFSALIDRSSPRTVQRGIV